MILEVIRPICSWVLALLLVYAFFSTLRTDTEGRPAKPAQGFRGVVATVIASVLNAILLWGAGAFDRLFWWQ